MKVVVAIVIWTLLAVPTAAQVPTGTIVGLVTDSSGAVLPSAIVTLTNRDTGESRTVPTTSAGEYAAPVLSPGTYRIVASARGFTRLEGDATVEAGTTTTVNLALDVGEVSEAVEVAAAAPRLTY